MTQSMSKEEARKALAALNAEHVRKASELLAIISAPAPKGLWQPKAGDNYWSLYCGGYVSETKAYTRTTADDMTTIASHGLVFPSPHIARKAATLLARSNKWIAAALQADEDAGEWTEDRNWTVWSASGVLKTMAPSFPYGRDIYVHTKAQAEEYRRILIAEGLGK